MALLAITFNLLQPLLQAAALRDGNPPMAGMRASMCQSSDEKDARPDLDWCGNQHECCLGIAHAPPFAVPASCFSAVGPIATVLHFARAVDALPPVGIRDGPHQPRAPPAST